MNETILNNGQKWKYAFIGSAVTLSVVGFAILASSSRSHIRDDAFHTVPQAPVQSVVQATSTSTPSAVIATTTSQRQATHPTTRHAIPVEAVAETSRAARAAQCIKDAEQKAVSKFEVVCQTDPKINGGSPDYCILDDKASTIRYIEIAGGVSLDVFEINKQLGIDRELCAKLYGN